MTRKKSDAVAIQIRMKEPLRASIEDAASERGVSMNAEMVRRLEWSFIDDTARAMYIHSEFGGPLNFALGEVIGRMAEDISGAAWAPWFNNPFVFREFRRALDVFLDALTPPPSEEESETASFQLKAMMDPEYQANLGKAVAEEWLRQIAGARDALPKTTKSEQATRDRRVARRVAPELAPLIGRNKSEN